jgi:hypothetical protein
MLRLGKDFIKNPPGGEAYILTGDVIIVRVYFLIGINHLIFLLYRKLHDLVKLKPNPSLTAISLTASASLDVKDLGSRFPYMSKTVRLIAFVLS